jgi:hypothetical protein
MENLAHSSFVVGQRVVATKGEYTGDEGVVLRQAGAKTVYRFQVNGQWAESEWAYDSAMHDHHGILKMNNTPAPAVEEGVPQSKAEAAFAKYSFVGNSPSGNELRAMDSAGERRRISRRPHSHHPLSLA